MTTQEAGSGIARRRAEAKNSSSDGYNKRRAEMVAAAAKLFKAKGFGGTTLADIAQAIGADRASLYYYIGSKEELLDEVVTDVVIANTSRAEQIRDSEDAAPAKLRILVTELMMSYATHYPFLYVYLQENLAQVAGNRQAWSKQMRSVNRRWEAAVEAIVVQGITEGSLRAVTEPKVMAFGLIGMVSWSHRWFNPTSSKVDARSIGEAYAEMLLSGLLA